jgi:hypothetical protein
LGYRADANGEELELPKYGRVGRVALLERCRVEKFPGMEVRAEDHDILVCTDSGGVACRRFDTDSIASGGTPWRQRSS